MTCLEYLIRLTDNGTKVRLGENEGSEYAETIRIGDETNYTEQVVYKTAPIGERKRQEVMLEKISYYVGVLEKPYQFYRHVMKVVPKDFRNGEYDTDPWTELFEDLTIELCAKYDSMMTKGRNTPGARIMLAKLQARCEAFKHNVAAKVKDKNNKEIANIVFSDF